MNKKYQIFVSSTYNDLIDERKEVIQAILECNCFPSGVELFPATDEKQWDFIKKAIDESDYYLLIIAGRYGSETIKDNDNRVSTTEMEYDYAVKAGKPIIALLRNNIESLPPKLLDNEKSKAKKLEQFRNKVMSGRIVAFWNNKDDLKSQVISSLYKLIKEIPATGRITAEENKWQNNITELMISNLEEQRAYYTISKNKAKVSFCFSILTCILGFLLLSSSVYLIITKTAFEYIILIAIAGVLSELFAGISLLVYRKSTMQLNRYSDALQQNEMFLSTINLANKLSSDKQDEMYVQIIQHELKKRNNDDETSDRDTYQDSRNDNIYTKLNEYDRKYRELRDDVNKYQQKYLLQQKVFNRMDDNLEEIRAYFTISKSHAWVSFSLAIVNCIVGIILLVLAVYYALNKPEVIEPAIIASIGGAVSELFAGTSLLVHKKSLLQLNHYYDALHENEMFLSAINLVGNLNIEKQNEICVEIIQNELKVRLNKASKIIQLKKYDKNKKSDK